MSEAAQIQAPQDTTRPRSVADAIFDRAPIVSAAFAFLAGAFSLLSAANPDMAGKPMGLWTQTLYELPNLAAAGAGVALMALSVGLRRRLKTAWLVCLLLAAHGAAIGLFYNPRPMDVALHLALIFLLVASRRAFYRRSTLSEIRFGRLWFVAAGIALTASIVGASLWAGHMSGFAAAPWWALVVDPILGQAGRPVAFAAGTIALLAFVKFVALPARPIAPVPGDADFAAVSQILSHPIAARPEAVLAYAGDKSFLFSPERDAFLMYAVTGGGFISMGGPVGPKSRWRALLSAFRDEAERAGVRPAIYAAPPELLPDLLDLGFRVEKIGENAVLDLANFSLSGRKREVIRRGRRKLAERQGATFKIVSPPHDPAVLDRLKPVSDAWLTEQNGEEKAFSLGKFDAKFLDACPIGIVEIGGDVIAFGTLWTTPDKGWSAIDLMRYDPAKAPTNTMDFLLTELILWARDQGYEKFDLAMAPLSGLAEDSHAPLFARLGRLIYDHGERVYNFQGLKRFKQKFNPEWEPRYLAAPGPWSLPVVLAEAALLTNGGAALPGKRSANRKSQSL